MVINTNRLTVRVSVNGIHKLSVRRVQSIRGISSFKHGPSRIKGYNQSQKYRRRFN